MLVLLNRLRRGVFFPSSEKLVAKVIGRIELVLFHFNLLIIQLSVGKGTGAVNRSIAGVGLLDGKLTLRILIEEAIAFQLNLLIIQLGVRKSTGAINRSILRIGALD